MEFESTNTKKQYKRYNSDVIKLALNEIKSEKISVYAAAKKYHVPKSTLQISILNNKKKKSGSPQIISIENEQKIADWIKECARKGDPRTKEELFQAAIQFD
ncbi:hypothetical protein PVAND_007280 [Polypedilum vanderplanki]|uniref:HTH psq-type domain-containing protein n=1 Tax=Polypedilum vanderplanki TaxID=319348 RepID=A0A9J6C6G8_POLVA|nr:hypothetical protein PVAND_007280 [Polypedilum vanderplanki]